MLFHLFFSRLGRVELMLLGVPLVPEGGFLRLEQRRRTRSRVDDHVLFTVARVVVGAGAAESNVRRLLLAALDGPVRDASALLRLPAKVSVRLGLALSVKGAADAQIVLTHHALAGGVRRALLGVRVIRRRLSGLDLGLQRNVVRVTMQR